MNEDKMLKDEILDVLAKQLNGGEMLRIRNGAVPLEMYINLM